MILLVGLGNPGARYAGNRHNVGFMAVDAIAAAHGLPAPRRRFQGLLAEGRVAGVRVGLLKPQTYMNDSGQSVGEAMRFYKLSPADVVVFHDELDLAPGKLRIKAGGGSAGHNGLRSLISHIGAGFRRVRIGIGHPGEKARVTGHVLKDFAKADAEWLEKELDAIADNFPLLVKGDDGGFMNKVALAVNPPPPPKPKKPAPGPDEDPSDGI